MPSGTSTLIYLQQPDPTPPLNPENCYVQVRLHSARAYVEAGWFRQVAELICATQVSSSFVPGHRSGSIHKITTIKKDSPSLIGLSVNLTDWLPAVPEHKVSVELQLAAVMGSPFGELSKSIDQLQLESKLALASPELAVGAKVAEIAGAMLSVLLQEGQESTLVSLTTDLNIQSLKAGLYGAVAPFYGVDIPPALLMRENGTLDAPYGALGDRANYAVFEVAVLERRGREAVRSVPWWESLQDAQQQIEQMPRDDEDDVRAVNSAWRKAVGSARRLAKKDKSFLEMEIKELLQLATLDLQQALQEPDLLEASGLDVFPDDLAEALGVRTMPQLRQSVVAYEQALERSSRQG